ncbi:MAG: NAD(P)/FAD-dependent oxidoreductase, partial [Nanoarchaeota archaeon]
MKSKKSSLRNKLDEVVFEPRQKFDYKADGKIFYDVIIIGSGVVGLSAGMYAGRLGLKTLVIGEIYGGTITLTHVVENYPGFVSLSGPKLAELMLKHAMDYDIDIMNSKV